MDPAVERALEAGGLIDITVVGRKSGNQQTIEIAFHNIDGRLYISGMPGKRDWYANLLANPHFTFHLKQGIRADLPATATPITDTTERHRVLTHIVKAWKREQQLDAFVDASPLVEVRIEPA